MGQAAALASPTRCVPPGWVKALALSPRHCERSEAIQDRSADEVWIASLRSQSMECEAAMSFFQLPHESQTRLRGLAAQFARVVLDRPPSNPRGRREGRVPTRTRGLLRKGVAQKDRTAAYR